MASSNEASTSSQSMKSQRIVFFHPDLGIGGAERLIIDAAIGLQDLGHKVVIFTSHCDPRHCFEEARDGTLDVRVRGNTLFPPTVLGRFHILLAILRQLHLLYTIAVSTRELRSLKPDVFIVDQLPSCVPFLRWLYPGAQRTLFYCHFPDQLLVQRKETGALRVVKDVYRLAFDWFEGWTMSASDRIVVNSNFTKSVSKKVFPQLDKDLEVIHPCVSAKEDITDDAEKLWNGKYKILLSINRFERKKDIGLAIGAYHQLSPTERKSTRLILAGGYDHRVTENVQYHEELVKLAESLDFKQATAKTVPTALAIQSDIEILFLQSVPDVFKQTLLRNASLLLYTPTNEHFGIVPVEAMQYGVPVLASNTGGPLETIVEGETGWLRDVRDVDGWTKVMRQVLEMTPKQAEAISAAGKRCVKNHFTRSIMAEEFNSHINTMQWNYRSKFVERDAVVRIIAIVGMFVAAFISILVRRFLSATSDGRASEFARIRRQQI